MYAAEVYPTPTLLTTRRHSHLRLTETVTRRSSSHATSAPRVIVANLPQLSTKYERANEDVCL